MKDYVKCIYCDWIGLVELGEEICPNCGCDQHLTWADENEKEVDDI